MFMAHYSLNFVLHAHSVALVPMVGFIQFVKLLLLLDHTMRFEAFI